MQIEISNAVLAGMAAGAGTMMEPVAAQCVLAAIGESMMSLGGSGGLWSKLGKGALIYVPAGAAVGLVVVLSGYAWWVAIPASGGVMAAIIAVYKLLRRRARV
jgi:hypothetical protein